ncbi:Fe-Mn family superoxide dismutase (plasmid) [Burkholderia vietnamiensis]|nr:Fe-Mn family superoxide dismutase [Burkholderia vietnamiensis]
MILHEIDFDCLGASGKPAAISKRHSRAISAASSAGGGVFRDGQGARAAVPAGCCSRGRRGSADSSTSGRPDHTHTLADGAPVLALDMYEHSLSHRFRCEGAAYVDAFMENINWTNVADRFASVSG